MAHPWCRVASILVACSLCSSVMAQDTYTQGASTERRAPAETIPVDDQQAGRDVSPRDEATDAKSAAQIPAKEIAAAVENELYHDVVLSLDDVGVRVERGTATLTGAVASLMAKQRAAEVARTVKGVTTVVNKLAVRPSVQRDADEIEAAISRALVVSPATEAFQVQVQAELDGSVRLSGNVDSWTERELVERVASTVVGVTGINNELQVRYAGYRPDTEIAAEVERMLQWDAYIEDGRIDVDVRNGVVTLSGLVGSAAEKERARRIGWTAGTKDVIAKGLRVSVDGVDGMAKRPRQLSDANIESAVKGRLWISPYIPETSVDVLVDGGVVTLSGTVDSLKAKRAAASIAAQTSGVSYVRNRLRVRPSAPIPSDAELTNRIEGALAANTTMEAYEIAVDVHRGAVTLSGEVDSWFEKGVADDVAASVRGVRAVDNDLRVENTAERLASDPYVDTWSIYDYDWYQPAHVTIWKQDAILEEEIENELWWSPFVDANEVNVTVENGVATLVGSVDSFAESSAAQENAFEGGAAGVINKLNIEG